MPAPHAGLPPPPGMEPVELPSRQDTPPLLNMAGMAAPGYGQLQPPPPGTVPPEPPPVVQGPMMMEDQPEEEPI